MERFHVGPCQGKIHSIHLQRVCLSALLCLSLSPRHEGNKGVDERHEHRTTDHSKTPLLCKGLQRPLQSKPHGPRFRNVAKVQPRCKPQADQASTRHDNKEEVPAGTSRGIQGAFACNAGPTPFPAAKGLLWVKAPSVYQSFGKARQLNRSYIEIARNRNRQTVTDQTRFFWNIIRTLETVHLEHAKHVADPKGLIACGTRLRSPNF